jgi:CheY-like chemotaxis protein
MPHRLLLADDSVTVQRVIELTFADEDVTVVAVSDGDQAVARLQAEPFDIVLADVGMPGRTGYEVAQFLRERPDLTHIPVILLTGAFEKIDDTRVAASGASAVLAKPFEPQMVIAKVRELIGRGARQPVTLDSTPAPPIVADAPVYSAAGAGAPTGSVDDYFDRLDRAFANLDPQLEPRTPAVRPDDARAPAADANASSSAAGGGATTRAGASELERRGSKEGLADTFATLLAVEQGELPASALLPPPHAGDEALVDRIARRVVEQLGDGAVRELAADIVSRTAERLVREEIERIKNTP